VIFIFKSDDECKSIKNETVIKEILYILDCHLGWMDMRKFRSVWLFIPEIQACIFSSKMTASAILDFEKLHISVFGSSI